MTPYAITALILAVSIGMFAIGLTLGHRMALEESTRRMRSRIRTLPEAHTPITPTPIEVAPVYEADDDDDEWEWWADDPYESTPSYAAEQLAWYEEQAESETVAEADRARVLARMRRDLADGHIDPPLAFTLDDAMTGLDVAADLPVWIDRADPQNIWPE